MMRNAFCMLSILLAPLAAKPADAFDLPALNLGLTSFLDGGPPAGPGFYFQNYSQYYWASRLNGDDGDEIPLPGTDVDVLVNILQGIYMSDHDVLLGGKGGINTILPVAAPTISFDDGVAGPQANNAGLGDLLIGPFIQWGPYIGEKGPTFMHRIELQTIWPTGSYDSDRELNPGSNFFSFNPYWSATTWLTPDWTASWRLHYLWNAKNTDPNRGFVGADDTQAGQAVHANFATSYAVTPKLRLGISGYALKQITDTKVDGDSVAGRREAAFAIGPGLLYSFSQDHHIFVNGYHEAYTENRAQGDSVLLIEAGGPDNSEAISTPLRLIELWQTEFDWGYLTVPQKHCKDRRIYWPRGKTLGGSSSLNGMIYVRGHASDYDSWAEAGNSGWDYESVLPYFKKSEDYQRGADEYHGSGGLLHVTADYTPHPVTEAFVEAAVAAGHSFNDDCNGADSMGVGYTHLTTKDGKRHSTAAAFLRPALERENLSLITNARVRNVVMEGAKATGVRYMQEGEIRTVTATKEIILSGGTLESPRILMLSGIGEKAQLAAFDIPVVTDLPGVGKNLHDHTLCPVIFEGAKDIPPPSDPAIQPLHGHAFMKTDPDLSGPDVQPLFFHVPTYLPGEQEAVTPNGFTINAGGIRPTSRGELRITSADPEADLMLDPNLLATDYDVETLVHNIKLNREIAAQEPLASWVKREIYPGDAVQSDEDLADYARSANITYHHQVGTCKMGSDDMAVVDHELKVHGVEGLRVIDASIMPTVTSGNTNAPTIMIAEKGADLIKAG